MRKMQQVGTLPAAELAAFGETSIAGLMRHLATCNTERAAFSHVNKKALDQYVNFSEQRCALLERKKELDDGATAIDASQNRLSQQTASEDAFSKKSKESLSRISLESLSLESLSSLSRLI